METIVKHSQVKNHEIKGPLTHRTILKKVFRQKPPKVPTNMILIKNSIINNKSPKKDIRGSLKENSSNAITLQTG